MTPPKRCIVPLLLGILAFSTPLWTPSSAEAMRCGSRLVRTGQTRSEVQRLCGEPVEVSRSELVQSRQFVTRFRRVAMVNGIKHVTQVERWVYALGRGRFLREVTFHDGRVVLIKRLRGRGR